MMPLEMCILLQFLSLPLEVYSTAEYSEVIQAKGDYSAAVMHTPDTFSKAELSLFLIQGTQCFHQSLR